MIEQRCKIKYNASRFGVADRNILDLPDIEMKGYKVKCCLCKKYEYVKCLREITAFGRKRIEDFICSRCDSNG